MDPNALNPAIWSELGSLLRNLWLVVLFIILFASNMIIGHNFIPSFVATEHISRSWQKSRPVFYFFAILFFALAMFFLSRVIIFAGVLRDFWPVYFL